LPIGRGGGILPERADHPSGCLAPLRRRRISTDRTTCGPSPENAVSDVPPLAGTTWYVPPQNVLAYLCDPALRARQAVADQTIWSIGTADGGTFAGTSTTKLWAPRPDGTGMMPLGTSTTAMSGTISDGGEVVIEFTAEDTGLVTTGYGHARDVDGVWRMEMQMATGTQSLALHWAYMTPWTGAAPPEPPRALPDPDLRSDEWRWLVGTRWAAEDQELFPRGATFAIDSYRNGYFWGEGTVSGGGSLRTAGSVTPEGTLYILFSVDDAPAVARRGLLASGDTAATMAWTAVEGGAVVGSASEQVPG
jgi:hypothetical protein